ncbi:5-formyltetrahydrofolate cyclo-ligase [Gordonia sp. VNQ95]|uniref:5-formyltetrahydrofolate cyclo-ligase n=1 Tax=Gordonia sp. VNQ95 TaxID=3156619 RepID=UPI0032B5E290
MGTTKRQLREEFVARRAAMSVDERDAAAARLAAHMAATPFGLDEYATVAAYVPVGAEPGSVAMLDALADTGATVLLPVVPPGDPQPLEWVSYTGPASLERRRWGLLEPTGPHLGTDAIRSASVIIVPALAVSRSGVRLGRGAGYYDRSIAGVPATLVAVVYDGEVVDELPGDAYDVPMGWVVTPEGGFEEIESH